MRATLAERVKKLYATLKPHGVEKPQGRYNFLPHCGVQERVRRCRQAAYGQLPPEVFRTRADYDQARQAYFALVRQQRAA